MPATQITTDIRESDGTVVPRGWYFFVNSSAPNWPGPQAYGPFLTPKSAMRAMRRFLGLVNAKPIYVH